ncbi:monomethylamine:corrinoid methyltransferase [Candidatus Hecatella orcuttiae]|jgi:methylamine--corrinoid protein Co-methyltransferase|uniref:monomethylamine:corrinoid methyltransferase n=1 Tax=Candidatus Hecatella orcuttiae TaxID=1935119 RepID=UPI002867F020|nr:monomethylamine:corrinoid methyltransferase [Candidatus Hecatella orcuttiae]
MSIPPGILEVLDRTCTGPVCTERDWDIKVIGEGVLQKLKEHGLSKTFDKDNPINCDDGLADDFYRAGFEFAVETGMLCSDTGRVVRFTEEELKEALKDSPSELTLGEGLDRFTMRARKPEDEKVPIYASTLGIGISEDLWVPLMLGVAQYRVIDMLEGPTLETVYGRPIISRTPYETLAGYLQAKMHQEVIRRAGRPGMAAGAVITSPTEYGQFGGYGVVGGYKPTDVAIVLFPSELKTSYSCLHKVVHAINCGGIIRTGSWSMIGGYSGSPEGSIISAIAIFILERPVHQAVYGGCGAYDLRYFGNCGREALWANSVVFQALGRNTHLLTEAIINQVAGPCTEMLLYESAVGMMSISVSSASMAIGPRSAGGKYSNYISPLEAKFCAEVFKSCAGMKRKTANDIAKALLPKYENRLFHPPLGKKFTECFDLKTLKPTKEWREIYDKVKREIIDLGIPVE